MKPICKLLYDPLEGTPSPAFVPPLGILPPISPASVPPLGILPPISPASVSPLGILPPSSRTQRMEGVGRPRASHVNVTSLPSSAVTSRLLLPSTITGGTAACKERVRGAHTSISSHWGVSSSTPTTTPVTTPTTTATTSTTTATTTATTSTTTVTTTATTTATTTPATTATTTPATTTPATTTPATTTTHRPRQARGCE
ncbi:hypothetical protein FHG87_008792 [Trinorchestia longiramus]|nr:hypothetical protein FHG87_008792 [Trinorchestia longiramus]